MNLSALKRALPLVMIFAALGLVVTAIAQNGPRTIPIEEITPGMTGYGMTVFQGTEPQRFDVRVIGVQHGFRPGQNLILVHTDHPILDNASTVAGMSGSPIYLDGRLAGAYAYGWSFGKDPVAGVTPIRNMLREMERPIRAESFPGATIPGLTPRAANTRSRRPRLSGLAPYTGRGEVNAFTALSQHAARVAPAGAAQGLQQAATPLMLGGFDPQVINMLREHFEPLGLLPLTGGGTGSAPEAAGTARYVDGGAIGVQLIRGDVNATATGTVTHVGSRRLIAFGHPMMNGGQLGLPATTARILHILASEARSFKISEPLTPKGAMIHDRQSAIVIDQEMRVPTIPVRVRIHGVDGAPQTEWNAEVVSHRMFTPSLSFAVLANTMKATASDNSEAVFRAVTRVQIEGHPDLELTDVGYLGGGPGGVEPLTRVRAFAGLEAVYGNPFEETRVTGIEIDLHLEFTRDVFAVVDAGVMTDEVDPGSTIPVRVSLHRYGHPVEHRTVTVDIPESAAGEQLTINLAAGNRVRLDYATPNTLDDILDIVRQGYSARQLVASIQMPSRGLRFRGHITSHLPSSALDALQLANDEGGGMPFVTRVHQAIDMDKVVVGEASVRVRVRETARE